MDSLRSVFQKLELVMEGEAAIRFVDAAVFASCLPLWDADGDGYIAEEEAKAVKRFVQGALSDRDDIVSLDDLNKLGGYMYHAGNFKNNVNMVTAATGLRYNINGSIDDFTVSYQGCTKLERIKIHPSIKTVSILTFTDCTSLKTVEFGGNETIIGQSAFEKCSSLEAIELPAGVTQIGGYAFRHDTSLRSINLDNIVTLGPSCFSGCTSLGGDINLPNLTGELNQTFGGAAITSVSNLGKVTSILNFAFGSCPNLKSVVLPSTLTSIGSASFYNSRALEAVICLSTTPPALNSAGFNGTSCLIYVPDASLDAYKVATNWANIVTKIQPLSTYVEP